MNYSLKYIIIFFIVFIFIYSVSLIAFSFSDNHRIVESPAKSCDFGDVVCGYIVTGAVSDNQLYALLPNDDTVYLITISCDRWNYLSFKDKLLTFPSDYFEVVDCEIANLNVDKSPKDLHKKS